MRIGIDVRLLERRTTGVGRYVLNLVRNIPELDPENEYFLFSYGKLTEYEKERIKNISTLGFNPKGFLQKITSPFWLNFTLPKYLKKYAIDLFFSPNHFLPRRKLNIKSIVLICDVFHKVNKKYQPFFYRKYADFSLASSIRKSDFIITISNHSKKDIINFYNVAQDKIGVVYLAAEESFKPRLLAPEKREYFIKKYNLPSRFVLYAGIIDIRKNIDGIIEVADILVNKQNKDIYFVLTTGNPSYYKQEAVRKAQKIKKGHIIFLDNIESEDLPFLYNLADIMLFPSFYEGFGLPPLEAMQSGLPVVTSNSSSLPEVMGDGGIIHNPKDYEGFAESIIKLLEDKEFYEKVKRQGIGQAKKFSWEKATKETIEIFSRHKI